MVSGAVRAFHRVLAGTREFIVGNRAVRVSALQGHAEKARAAADRHERADRRLAAGIRSPESPPGKGDATAENPLPQRPDKARPETTGLGAEVDRLAGLSPTLQQLLRGLKRSGWTIAFRDIGGGAYVKHSDTTITVDSGTRDDPEELLRVLAHEAGHAYPSAYKPQEIPYHGQGRTRWVRSSAFEYLRDEGEAALVEGRVLREVAEAGGPRLRPTGQFGAEYEKHYAQYRRGEMTRDEARDENAHYYMREYRSGRGENGTPETYLAHYEAIFHRVFDNDPGMRDARMMFPEGEE